MRGIKLFFIMFLIMLTSCSTSDFMSDFIKKKGNKNNGDGGGPGVTVIVIVGSEEKVSILNNGKIKREPVSSEDTKEKNSLDNEKGEHRD